MLMRGWRIGEELRADQVNERGMRLTGVADRGAADRGYHRHADVIHRQAAEKVYSANMRWISMAGRNPNILPGLEAADVGRKNARAEMRSSEAAAPSFECARLKPWRHGR